VFQKIVPFTRYFRKTPQSQTGHAGYGAKNKELAFRAIKTKTQILNYNV
jgi:hypothetical protein